MSDIWINTGADHLLPCPFCQGGSFSIFAQRGQLYAVQCKSCGAVGPTTHSRGEAVALWNEQPALAAANARAEAAAWRDAGQCPLCSAPGTRASYDADNDVRVSYCPACKVSILWEPEERDEVQP